jgi:hypothetical protein
MADSQSSAVSCNINCKTDRDKQKIIERRTNDKVSRQDANKKHTVHWFRKGLRLHDNPSLNEGLAGASTFRCVFVLDPWFAGSTNVSINKWR